MDALRPGAAARGPARATHLGFRVQGGRVGDRHAGRRERAPEPRCTHRSQAGRERAPREAQKRGRGKHARVHRAPSRSFVNSSTPALGSSSPRAVQKSARAMMGHGAGGEEGREQRSASRQAEPGSVATDRRSGPRARSAASRARRAPETPRGRPRGRAPAQTARSARPSPRRCTRARRPPSSPRRKSQPRARMT